MEIKTCLAIILAFITISEASYADISTLQLEKFDRYVHVVLNEQPDGERYVLRHGKPSNEARVVGWAGFTDNSSDVGWSFLRIKTNPSHDDTDQVYAAGLMEGHLTRGLIENHWQNTVGDFCGSDPKYCQRLNATLMGNLNFINHKLQYRSKEPYWHQIGLILEQLSGLEDGYKGLQKGPRTLLDPFGLMLFNLFGDFEDLNVMLNKSEGGLRLLTEGKTNGHCSALIRLLPNNEDIYISQVTWNGYESMIRLIKRYDFSVHQVSDRASPLIPGRASSFSSYPGTLFSGDDFYVLGSGLVVQETTIGNANNELYKRQAALYPEVVFEWMRNIVANRLATNGGEWAYIFEQFNSGSYNNQFMIVDLKRFSPGSSQIANGLLTVLEQLPTLIHAADVTDVLREQAYWPSYNTPYFEDIFNASGAWEAVEKFGDWFTYDKTPRALIFKRDHSKVVDLESMIRLMRYNDFTHDPLSRCNCSPPYSAENAISARNDLNSPLGHYAFPALGHRSHGATDMKLTSYSMATKLELIAIGGPTYDPLPPFQWSKTDFGSTVSHIGQPDLWQFEPVHIVWGGN